MKKTKDMASKIYRMSANLNLYISICNPKKDRIKKELLLIKYAVDDLLKN